MKHASKKLRLNKETLRTLDPRSLDGVAGAMPWSNVIGCSARTICAIGCFSGDACITAKCVTFSPGGCGTQGP
jgi:hypothetical protein